MEKSNGTATPGEKAVIIEMLVAKLMGKQQAACILRIVASEVKTQLAAQELLTEDELDEFTNATTALAEHRHLSSKDASRLEALVARHARLRELMPVATRMDEGSKESATRSLSYLRAAILVLRMGADVEAWWH